MQQIIVSFRLSWGALLLRDKAYADVRDAPSPFIQGLTAVVVISILASLAAVVGQSLAWATSPSLSAMRDIVWKGMQKMPWYQELSDDAAFIEQFRQWFNLGWEVLPWLFGAPHPLGAVIGVVTRPVGLLIFWLVYGVLAHLSARIVGGHAKLEQTLGCTALAIAPQLLNFVHLLPYVQVGCIVGVWSLVCDYVALKNAHHLSWARTFWATILPLIIMGIALAAFIALLIAAGMAISSQGE